LALRPGAAHPWAQRRNGVATIAADSLPMVFGAVFPFVDPIDDFEAVRLAAQGTGGEGCGACFHGMVAG
jgi:hypothetical protein